MSDLRTQLLAVRTKRGALTPTILVNEARPTNHPLHTRFEWDDRVAGEAHRRQQARMLIATVVRYYPRTKGRDGSVREFHSIRGEATGLSSYEPIDDIIADPVSTEILLRMMRQDWLTLKRRYDHFAEFRKMVLDDMVGAQAGAA